MTRLVLRRGVVASCEEGDGVAELTVEVDGEPRAAVAFLELTGPVEPGDEVLVNTQARDLGLGSGGFDVLHANLTRGLSGAGEPGAHVMKLNYSPLQHAVAPVEEALSERRTAGAVAVLALHGQLPCVAWAAARCAPGARVGYVQTQGGALPGALSESVRELRRRELLAGHVTAAPCFGGEREAITVAGGIAAGFGALGWDAVVAGPGPGIVGSGTELGHGGLAALDTAHAALALGSRPVLVPRMSSGDPRERHRGLSHHTRTLLDLLLRPCLVALPEGYDVELGDHAATVAAADLDGYLGSGLPARTMGRSAAEDELFFRAALAGGAVLGGEIARRRGEG